LLPAVFICVLFFNFKLSFILIESSLFTKFKAVAVDRTTFSEMPKFINCNKVDSASSNFKRLFIGNLIFEVLSKEISLGLEV